jgi:hypothetical protein
MCGGVLAHGLHYDEAPEQLHRWAHSHEHLIEVDEDCHQCEEEGRQKWHQPSEGICREEDEISCSMLASDAIPWFSLAARPGTYNPISHCRLAREPIVLNHEDGSSAAMVVDGGQRLRRKEEV